jgi:acetoin utilization protein AcuB
MYVGWHMKTNLVTVSPETSILEAREMMDTHKVSHLPVTDGKAHLLGMITDRDLKKAWASPATTLSVYELTYVLQKVTVESIMSQDVIVATPDMTIEKAGSILHDRKIGALPVIKDEKLVGIITSTDLMEVLLMAMGVWQDSKRMSLIVRDRIGTLADVGELMRKADVNIRSIIIVPLRGQTEIWQLILRVNMERYEDALSVLRGAGFKVVTQYIEDLTPYLPE